MVVYELERSRIQSRLRRASSISLTHLHGLGVNVLELMPGHQGEGRDVEWDARRSATSLPTIVSAGRRHPEAARRRLPPAWHRRGARRRLRPRASGVRVQPRRHDTSGGYESDDGRFRRRILCGPTRHRLTRRQSHARLFRPSLNRYWLREYHVDAVSTTTYPACSDGPLEARLREPRLSHVRGLHGVPTIRRRQRSQHDHPMRRTSARSHRYPVADLLQLRMAERSRSTGARGMARTNTVSESFAHQLDPEFLGHPSEFRNPATGESFPVAPFQYFGVARSSALHQRVRPAGPSRSDRRSVR